MKSEKRVGGFAVKTDISTFPDYKKLCEELDAEPLIRLMTWRTLVLDWLRDHKEELQQLKQHYKNVNMTREASLIDEILGENQK